MPIAALNNSSNVLGLPNRSLSFNGSSQYLSIADSDFGSYDLTKFAVSVWVKYNSGDITVMSQNDSGSVANSAFEIRINSAVTVSFYGGSFDTTFVGSSTISGGVWTHLLIHFDPANATSSSRVKVWINGAAESSASFVSNSSTINNSTLDMLIGANRSAGSATSYWSDKLYQLGFFSGRLPVASEVYSSGAKDISYLPNLYSYIQTDTPNITDDAILTPSWTNNGTIILSSDVP